MRKRRMEKKQKLSRRRGVLGNKGTRVARRGRPVRRGGEVRREDSNSGANWRVAGAYGFSILRKRSGSP
mgnify:CR=1 FL=1